MCCVVWTQLFHHICYCWDLTLLLPKLHDKHCLLHCVRIQLRSLRFVFFIGYHGPTTLLPHKSVVVHASASPLLASLTAAVLTDELNQTGLGLWFSPRFGICAECRSSAFRTNHLAQLDLFILARMYLIDPMRLGVILQRVLLITSGPGHSWSIS